MKSTATSIHGQDKAEPARSHAGNPLRSNSSTGYLGQLAAAINGSPGALAQRELAQGIQNSPRVQGLRQLESEINEGAGVQPAPVAPVAQLVPVKRAVTGITHLVRRIGDSIFEGEEREEVSDGDIVEIDTDKKFTSRRGPNQEIYRDVDEAGPVIYEWYEVLGVNDDLADPDIYIRDRTFRPLNVREKIQQEIRGLGGGELDMAVMAAQTALHIYGCTLEDLDVTSSSGATLTYIPRGGSPTVLQYIRTQSIFQRIRGFYVQGVQKHRPSLEVRGTQSQYDLWAYIAQVVRVFPDCQSILVERVLPLHQLFSALPLQPGNENEQQDGPALRNQMLRAFIQRNSKKLIWDINKAIHGLYQAGYSQGDVRIDNIGIKDGNFVLFDYSGLRQGSDLRLEDDLGTFWEGLKSYGSSPISPDIHELLSEEDNILEKMIELQMLKIRRYL